MQRRFISMLLVFLLVFSMAPVTTAEESPAQTPSCAEGYQELTYDAIQLDPDDSRPSPPAYRGNVPSSASYYGREALKATAQGEKFVYAYDQIYLAVSQNETDSELRIMLDGKGHTFTQDELVTLVDTYRRDHPEHFWIYNQFSMMYYTPGQYVAVVLYMTMSGNDRTKAIARVESAADAILAGIHPNMTDYEKELYIHDALAAHITYQSNDYAHDIYGAMALGAAVCEGYAKAFQYMLRKVGIQSYIATGDGGGPHAWNYVQLGDQYYLTDLTWNDQGDDIYHAYFNVTDAMLAEDHIPYDEIYALPVCNSRDAFYFEGTAQYLDNYTVNSVAELLATHGMNVHLYIPGDLNTFWTWFETNIRQIAGKTGVNGVFSYGCNSLGHEMILRIIVDNTTMVVNGDQITQYATFQQAVNACPDGAYLRLMEDVQVNITLNKDLYVDLAGHDLTGTIKTGNHKIYGMDSATNSYSGLSGGTFSCGNAVPQSLYTTSDATRYMTIQTDAGYTFHRFYLGVTHVNLSPKVTGLGYVAEFYGDHLVRGQIASVGYDLWLNPAQVVSANEEYRNSLSLQLRNVDAATYGQTPIYACATMTLTDGTVLKSATAEYTLRQVVEIVNTLYRHYSAQQLSLVKTMLDANPIMKTWNISNL